MIPFNKPFLCGRETEYIKQAVESGKLSGNGQFTRRCQRFFEERYGFGRCLLTTSCTDALEMAAILIDIQPGDEVIVPSYTFVSTANAYVLRTFQRSDPEMGALCVHLGRAFLVEVTLQVGANSRLRCNSYRSYSAAELFAAPGSGSTGKTFSNFLDESGRVETILYAFTDNPWLKVWTETPEKPFLSREVSEPYNYPFSDNIPVQVSDVLNQIVSGNVALAPTFGAVMATVTDLGLTANLSWDLWGWSKDVLLYIKPTTLRVSECGFAVSCSRAELQRVLSEFHQHYLSMQQAYRDRGEYPMNCPVEIRVTGIDRPEDCLVPGAQVPLLSAARPWPGRPDWDCVVFFNILCVPGTPVAPRYYAELEQWFYANYASYAGVRVEWSKGWAYTDAGPYTNDETLGTRIPASFTQGMAADASFRTAVEAYGDRDSRSLNCSVCNEHHLPEFNSGWCCCVANVHSKVL